VCLPDTFRKTVVAELGERGREWLERLPRILEACASRWDLVVGEPFDLSFNYVVRAKRADDSDVVLKVGTPNDESVRERAALRVYDGRGVVRALASDEALGAVLLERILPGRMLAAVENDEEATSIAADVMRNIWRPAPVGDGFIGVEAYTRGLEEAGAASAALGAELVDRARRQRAELLATPMQTVLLHGDFHHFNVLSAEREPWLAIDPKGVVGEAAFEVGAFLHNPTRARVGLDRVLRRRIAIFGERLGLDRERLRKWGLVYAVLSAWWTYTSTGSLDRSARHALACAEALSHQS
jgi:streptomycin 6-kinase